ncbi:hypothetical protein OAN307_c04020 [Octadecabacter antarcticus 307]|uniref:Uncharacterized protein n=1 Tax=Octadecabacter antarcticus 307 TaxID=391626 RepID=M9R8Q7_9RHOB|nr:hypothetical protein [Octadecabacter antarcticus]AGI66145.1 hypothetical protein OAN307_c04020 [Octadecabacter antarcticus 307]
MLNEVAASGWICELGAGTTVTDWINALAALIGASAVLFGFITASSKFSEAQASARALRRSQIAEDLIALSHNTDDALRNVRSALQTTLREKVADKHYLFQKQHDKLVEYNGLFERLREAQIRARAVIGDDDVEASVEVFFIVRNRVSIANIMLAQMVDESDSHDDETRKHEKELRGDLCAHYGDQDELSKKIEAAVKTIELKLSPIARLDNLK